MAAPVIVDAAALATGVTDGSNQKTDSVTLTAGANFLLYGGAFVDATQQNFSAISYNGIPLTQVPSALIQVDATSVSRGWPSADLWYLTNPFTGGPANFVRTMNGGTPTRILDGISSWSGVDGTTPVGTAITVTGTVGATSISIAPATGTDEVAAGLMVTSADAATQFGPSGSGTEAWENYEGSSFGTGANMQYLAHSGGSSTNLVWTKPASTRRSVATAVALKPTASAGVTGTSAATEGSDAGTGSGTVTVSGSASPAEAADAGAASGVVTVAGSGGAAETSDAGSASGTVTVAGSAAPTEANDTSVGSGLVGDAIAGTSDATEADDAGAASGAVTVSGSGAAAEGADSSSSAGTVRVTGTSASTEGTDAGAGTGIVRVLGTASSAEGADAGAAIGFIGVQVFTPAPQERTWRAQSESRTHYLREQRALALPYENRTIKVVRHG